MNGKRSALAVFSGLLYVWGFAGFYLDVLAWVALVPLFFAIRDVSPRRAFFLGWLAGFTAHVIAFFWVVRTIVVFGELPLPVALLAHVLLAAAQSAQFGVFAWFLVVASHRLVGDPCSFASLTLKRLKQLTCRLTAQGLPDSPKSIHPGTVGASLWIVIVPAVWVAVEFLYPHLFPSYFANSQYAWTPLVQMADITGVLGISFLLVLVNAVLFIVLENIITQRRVVWKPLGVATMLVLLALVYGYWRLSDVERRVIAAPQLAVGMVQANIGIFEKREKIQDALQLHLQGSQMLEQQGAQLLVWPETAVTNPALVAGSDRAPEGLAGTLKIPLLTGIYERTPGVDPAVDYNTAVLMMPDGSLAGRYRKQVLLPFGEFIPFGEWFPKLYAYAPTIGRFTRGSSHEPITFAGLSLGVTICYEDILPRLVRKIALHDPSLFVNITNDSWFGETREPMIHLALATFRAIEHRRALVRATNTGISAIIDPAGRIVEQTPTFQQALILSQVPLLQGRTIYGMLGDWVGYLSLAALLVVVVRGRPWLR